MVNKYFLSMGLNDKDSGVQVLDTEETKKKACEMALKMGFGGLSVWTGQGVFTHEDGRIVFENSIFFTFYFAESSLVDSFVDFLKKEFNQESICVEASEVQVDFK